MWLKLITDVLKKIKEDGMAVVYGDAGHERVLDAAGVTTASLLILTIPDILTGPVNYYNGKTTKSPNSRCCQDAKS